MGRADHEDLVTDAERGMVQAMLLASGHRPSDADWMARSCPSMDIARAVCNQDRRRTIMRPTPSPEASAIRDAHAAFRKAIGTPLESQRYAEMLAVVDAIRSAAQERNQR